LKKLQLIIKIEQPNGGGEEMINTHEKLMKQILNQDLTEDELYTRLKEEGYQGPKEEMIKDLLYAISESTAYISNPMKISNQQELTEEEYFQILVNEMNVNY